MHALYFFSAVLSYIGMRSNASEIHVGFHIDVRVTFRVGDI